MSTLALACLLAAPVQAPTPCHAARLDPPAGLPVDRVGRDVALEDDLLVVGLWNTNPVEGSAGGAFVFRRAPEGHWTFQTKLESLDPDEDDDLGARVAVSGGRVLVGAPGHDGVGPWLSGSAYVFEETGGVWQQAAKLVSPAPGEGHRFGSAVALVGDRAFIGAPYDDGLVFESGAVFVFRRVPHAGWQLEAEIRPPDATPGQRFGGDLAVSGDGLVVSAPLDGEAGALAGALYVFRHDGSGWSFEAKLFDPDGGAGEQSGIPVAMDGDRIVLGLPRDEQLGVQAGAAQIFRREPSGTWAHAQKLLGSGVTAVDSFGSSVTIEGDRIAVGTPWDDDTSPDGGAVYLFELGPGGWTEVAKIRDEEAEFSAHFGAALDLEGDVLAAGAPSVAPHQGRAHVLELHAPGLLVGCPGGISISAGGAHELVLDAGPEHAFATHVLVGSASGTAPGVVLGGVTLPLNPDDYTFATAAGLHVVGGIGTLDGEGRAEAQLPLPAGAVSPSLVGLELHHAYVVLSPGAFLALASNAVPVVLAP